MKIEYELFLSSKYISWTIINSWHSLVSEQGIWASFGHQTLKNHPSRHQIVFVNFSENGNFKHIIKSFLLKYNSHDVVEGYYALFQ